MLLCNPVKVNKARPTARWRAGLVILLTAASWMTVATPSLAQDEEGLSDDLHGLEFRQVGPFRGGRSTTVTGHSELPFTYFMGTSGGGLWKTTNSGTSWQNISDGFFGSASVGAIEVAPSDLNVLYAGTGSGCPRGNIMNGDGIYRSNDGGATWDHQGLATAGLIPRIVVHPKNPDVVFAAVLGDIFEPNAERGVYRSRDGGDTWELVHFVSERTGAVDIAINPLNPRVLYASMWTAERKPWTLVDGSDEGGLWKSVDGGDSWNKLESGLPSGAVGRIGLAVSPTKPERVWAHFTAPHGEGGIFRTDDAGKSWDLVNGERKLQVRGWYYSHLEAHPTDPDTVFSIGLRFWKSIDGGKSFESIRTPHGDNHDLWIHPQHPEVMIEANDGGGTVTLDGGASWSTLHNQPTAEFYRLTVDQGFPFRLYGAQQDNSSISVPSWGEGGFSQEQDWWMAGGGESGHIAVHPERPEIVYSGNYIGLLERWDRNTGERKGVLIYPELADGVPPRDLKYRFQWNAPIRLSPHDPNVLYHTSHQVHRSTDDGDSWQTLTGDLSYDDEEKQALPGGPIQFDDTGVEVYSTVFAFEESAVAAGELWAGTDDGRVHLSRDNGASWTEVTPKGLEEDTTINTIELSSGDAGRAYIAAHRYRLGDDQPLIWRTDDHGRNWKQIVDGIAADHFVFAVREHPERNDLLVAGTERGLYVSFDSGDEWQPLQLNLPIARIADLAFASGGLAVATHGRSFWVLDDLSPLVAMSDAIFKARAHLFAPADGYRLGRSGGYSMGAQPDLRSPGAAIFVWLGEEADGMQASGTLSVSDADQQVVRETALVLGKDLGKDEKRDGYELEPGLNRLMWDYFGERPEALDGAVMSLGYMGPNQLPPGEYTVTVALQQESADDTPESDAGDSDSDPGQWSFDASQPLVVRADPRIGGDPKDARAAYELAEKAKAGMLEIHRTVGALRDLREQLNALEERLGGAYDEELREEVSEQSSALAEQLGSLEEELIQTKAEASQDGLNFPPKLDNHYSFLYGQLVGMASRPNEGAYQRLADLDAQWAPLEERWQALVDGPVAEMNALLERDGVGVVIVDR